MHLQLRTLSRRHGCSLGRVALKKVLPLDRLQRLLPQVALRHPAQVHDAGVARGSDLAVDRGREDVLGLLAEGGLLGVAAVRGVRFQPLFNFYLALGALVGHVAEVLVVGAVGGQDFFGGAGEVGAVVGSALVVLEDGETGTFLLAAKLGCHF